MKCFFALLLSILTFTPHTTRATQAQTEGHEYVIGIPAEMDEVSAKACFTQVLEVITKANEGDRVSILDAYGLRCVATFTVPALNAVAKNNPNARLNRLGNEVAQVRSFCKAAAEMRTGKTNQIRYPQLLERIAQLSAGGSGPRVLVFGSPFYQAEPAFSFGPDTWICDGALLQRLTDNPFGTAGREGTFPTGASVHFCYLSEGHFERNDLVRLAVQRFWNLYTTRLGGTLASFAGDPAFATQRALAGVREAVAQDRIGDEPPGYTVRRITVTTQDEQALSSSPRRLESAPAEQFSTPPTPASSSVPTRPSEQGPGARAVERALQELPKPKEPGFVYLACVWASEGRGVDVDLCVRPQEAAAELSYRNTTTPEGRHLRDIRQPLDEASTGRDWIGQWEVVELRSTTIEAASVSSCWLNLYRGTGKRVQGVVRLSDGARQVDVPFFFPDELTGDCGKGTSRRDLNNCWVQIDLAQALTRAAANPTGR
jgi:hypothetical protein